MIVYSSCLNRDSISRGTHDMAIAVSCLRIPSQDNIRVRLPGVL
jgi:hypothetical protein